MAELHLDPHSLAYPAGTPAAETMRNYVRSLVDWSAVLRERWVPVLIPESILELLGSVDRMPPWRGLATALHNAGVVELQPQDIVKLLGTLVSGAETVESAIHVNEILCDGESVDPPVDTATRGPEFSAAYHRLLAMACLCRVGSGDEEQREVVGLAAGLEPSSQVRYSGRLVDLEARQECRLSLSIPHSLDATFLTARSRESLYATIDPALLWLKARNVDGRTGAVVIGEYQYRVAKGDGVQPGESKSRWRFGDDFMNSATQHGFLTSVAGARRLIRAIVESILRVQQGSHALRTSSGGGAPQRRRGTSLAWRRDIDYEFHLHYWDGPEGCELANVVAHNASAISG